MVGSYFVDNQQLPKETDDEDGFMLTTDGNSKLYEQEDAELSLDQHAAPDSRNNKLYEQEDAELSLDQHAATDSSTSVFHE
ncbi:hypothetical protein SOVF_195050, partial [Spinacia oleracea]